jgi:SPP1 gp7 family putative phage head morphogenesis protein
LLARSTSDYILQNLKLVKNGTLEPEKKIERVMSSAIMDDKTTDLCAELNGLVVEIDSPIYQQYQTPRHYNCRSVWIPVTKEEIDNPRVIGTDISVDPSGKPYNEKTIITEKLGSFATQQKF